jgi:hypothetical protein
LSEEKEIELKPREEEKKNRLRQLYVRFYKSKWRWAIYIVLYLFLVLIPTLYTLADKLPLENELRQSNGELFFEYIPRKGTQTWLKTPDGDMLFSCKDNMGTSNDCYLTAEVKQSIQGKSGTIRWYHKPIYLWTEVNRIVELQVDNKQVISREQTQSRLHLAAKLATWMSIILIFVIVGVDSIYRSIFKIKRSI